MRLRVAVPEDAETLLGLMREGFEGYRSFAPAGWEPEMPPVERYAGTAAVVTGQQVVGSDHDVPLGERARVSSALIGRLAAVPGVRAAIGDGCPNAARRSITIWYAL